MHRIYLRWKLWRLRHKPREQTWTAVDYLIEVRDVLGDPSGQSALYKREAVRMIEFLHRHSGRSESRAAIANRLQKGVQRRLLQDQHDRAIKAGRRASEAGKRYLQAERDLYDLLLSLRRTIAKHKD